MTKDELKLLVEVAKTCRKAGISYFKNESFEFSLTAEAPPALKPRGKSAKRLANKNESESIQEIETDSLSDEELLLWSTGIGPQTQSQ